MSALPADGAFEVRLSGSLESAGPEEADPEKPGLLARLLPRLRNRRTRKAPDSSESSHSVAAFGSTDLAEEPPEDLYYLTGDGRSGPVSLSVLYQMITDGELGMDTPVSVKGTTDWLTFPQYLRAREERAAADPATGQTAIPWRIALAPLWGGLVPVLATQVWISLGYRPLAQQAQLWWTVAVVMAAVSFLDLRALRKPRRKVGIVDLCLCLLPPAYLFRRQKTVTSLLITVAAWSVSCLVTLAGFVLVNGYNAPLITVVERMIHVHLP